MGGQIESIISVWLFCLFNQALHGSVGYGRFTVGFVFHPDIVHAKRVIIVSFFCRFVMVLHAFRTSYPII